VRAEHLEFAANMYIWSKNQGTVELPRFRDAMWRVAKGDKDLYDKAMAPINRLYYEHESVLKVAAKKAAAESSK
jgi:hypothetical protein